MFQLFCPLWVISGQLTLGQNRVLSALPPIADKRGRGWIVRYVPIATSSLLSFTKKMAPTGITAGAFGPGGKREMVQMAISAHRLQLVRPDCQSLRADRHRRQWLQSSCRPR